MKSIPRKSLVVSLAAALSLGISATAFGDGAGDQTSEMSGNVSPSLQDDTTPGKANLFTQVSTLDTDNTPAIPAFPAEIVRVDFPEEMVYKTNNKLDQCDPEAGTFAADGTDAAVTACADALVGSGSSYARIPGYPLDGGQAELTVAAFNGPTSVAGDQISSDVASPGFDGGNPTIVLHADNAVVPTTVVLGEVRDSPNAGFGKQLNVTDAPDVGADTGALVLFNAQVNRSWTNGKTGNKKKKYSLISAACSGDGDWDFQTTWTYDDSTNDTFAYSQDCTVK